MVEAPRNTEPRRSKFLNDIKRKVKYGVAALTVTGALLLGESHPASNIAHAETPPNPDATIVLTGFDRLLYNIRSAEDYRQGNTLLGGSGIVASIEGSNHIVTQGGPRSGQNGTSYYELPENHTAVIDIKKGARGHVGHYSFNVHEDTIIVVSGHDLSMDEQGNPARVSNMNDRQPLLPAPPGGRDQAFIVFDEKDGPVQAVIIDKGNKLFVDEKVVKGMARPGEKLVEMDLSTGALSVAQMKDHGISTQLTKNWERPSRARLDDCPQTIIFTRNQPDICGDPVGPFPD